MSLFVRWIVTFILFSWQFGFAFDVDQTIKADKSEIIRLASETHLTAEAWVKFVSQVEGRCLEAANSQSEAEAIRYCRFYYAMERTSYLFSDNPAGKRTRAICIKYLGEQRITKDPSIHQYLEQIVEKLCLKP